jgi:cullin 2
VAHPEPHTKRLFEETKKLLEAHITETNAKLTENNDESLLNSYNQFWLEYSKGSEYLNHLFM